MRKLIQNDYESVKQFTDSINLFEAQELLAAAWDTVSETTVKNSWKNLCKSLNEETSPVPPDNREDYDQLLNCSNFSDLSRSDIDDWMESDNHEVGYKIFSNEEIAELVQEGLDPLNLPVDEADIETDEIEEAAIEPEIQRDQFDAAANTVVSYLKQKYHNQYNDIIMKLGKLQFSDNAGNSA